MAIHQSESESLTDFLRRLEPALNEFYENSPLEATPQLLYDVYRGSLAEKTRLMLDTKYNFLNRARELEAEGRTMLLRECLYTERKIEVAKQAARVRQVTATGGSGTGSQKWRCRTCATNEHHFASCAKALAAVQCPRCDGANHFRNECPKVKKSETKSSDPASAAKADVKPAATQA